MTHSEKEFDEAIKKTEYFYLVVIKWSMSVVNEETIILEELLGILQDFKLTANELPTDLPHMRDKHMKVKVFNVGDDVIVFMRKERFPVDEALYQEENSGSSSSKVKKTYIGRLDELVEEEVTLGKIWQELCRIWNYVDGTFVKPTDKKDEAQYAKELETWDEFYSTMTNLLDQLPLMESIELEVVNVYTDQREEQQLVEYLMALRDDFECLRGGILTHKGVFSTPQYVFATPFHKGKPQGRVELGIDECSLCKEKGHWKAQFLKAAQKLLATQSCAMPSPSIKALNYSCLSVTTADGTHMPLAGIGSISTPNLSFYDVYYIPNLTLSLAFVIQLCGSGYSFMFSSTSCCVQDPHYKRMIRTGRRQGGLYVLDELRVPDTVASIYSSTTNLLSYFRL
ncbi:hypothetical protein KIW84_071317 [Lathyrus oleraceus]|uniref:Uncharacterized protein n=1 Tax=Pisum sativum TaxID=3888 RepID=A0A9D4VJ51_PEA|nr:hypothetical protein KIW84_071317 [Pisum sativum]